MATESHSQKISGVVHLEADGLLNAATISPTTITLERLDCFSGFEGCSLKECWCVSLRHPPGVDQGLRSPANRCHSQRSAGDADHQVINPYHHLGDGHGGDAFGSEGQAHDHKKGTEDLTAPITKQPTLLSRLSTTGTILISRNF